MILKWIFDIILVYIKCSKDSGNKVKIKKLILREVLKYTYYRKRRGEETTLPLNNFYNFFLDSLFSLESLKFKKISLLKHLFIIQF